MDGMPERAHPDSIGEVMLRLALAEEKYRLDQHSSAMFRTMLAPEDVLEILRSVSLKAQIPHNASALFTDMAKSQVQRAKANRLVAVVPMLRWIDKMRDQWSLDEEAEGILKFGVPAAIVLEWLEQIGVALREAQGSDRDAARFVKNRLRRMLRDLRPASRRPRSRSRSRDRRRDSGRGPPGGREAERPLQRAGIAPPPQQAFPPLPPDLGDQLHQPSSQMPQGLRAVPLPVAPGRPTFRQANGAETRDGKAAGAPPGVRAGPPGSGKASSKGTASGRPVFRPASDAAGDLMAQIQKLQSQLEIAKRTM